jgi:hypothetical protein
MDNSRELEKAFIEKKTKDKEETQPRKQDKAPQELVETHT